MSGVMMSEYKIVAILWRDHTFFESSPLNHKKAVRSILPTLSIGFLWKETDETVTLVSDVERHHYGDTGNFTVIFKGAIVATQEYGTIEISGLKGG